MSELKPGRELDALVAEKVMGLDLECIPEECPYCGGYVCQNRDKGWCGNCCVYLQEPKPYSTDISAAFEALGVLPTWTIEKTPKGKYVCMIKDKEVVVQISSELPMAITQAALRAVGHE